MSWRYRVRATIYVRWTSSINSLAPGRCGYNIRLISRINVWEIALRWVPRDPLMISQHCFMWWFGAITRTKVDQDWCRHVVRAWCGTGDTPLLRPTRTQSTATYLTGPLYPLSAKTSWSHRPRIWHTSQQWCCRCAQSDCNVIHCLDILR